MNTELREIAAELLHLDLDKLTERERRVVEHFAERRRISRNTNREFTEQLTLGQRVADRVAGFGGSWLFMGLFALVLAVWVLLNAVVLVRRDAAFDPYPFILLNLFLSMLAAVQAPIILMSQNRQAAKDRVEAAHDYEVNLKAELEILTLHEKLDGLREQQWSELVALQRQQIDMLEKLVAANRVNSGGAVSSEGTA